VKPAPTPLGEMADVGGRRLHVVCAGPAASSPLVLLEAGSFGFSADWSVVQAQLAARGLASLAYDRAGLGYSDPGPAPRDGLAIAADLEALLARLGEERRLIYVGHSMAGLHAHLFAARNPGRIAGMVLVDAVTPAAHADPRAQALARQYIRLAKAAAWAANARLLRPLAPLGDAIGLHPEAAARKRWAFADPGHNRAAADEVSAWEATAHQAAAAGPLSIDWPLAVVTAGPLARANSILTEPVRGARTGFLAHVAKANHASLLGRRHASAIIEAIEKVRAAADRT
jgi:pimeloyl-ACP methyl ester carboxylesterase